jgi:membrane-bound lytic murein transglycosylase D
MLFAQQRPVVPSKMNVAGISLTIKDDAKKEIQKDVDALWQSPKHFFIKVERARTYFPLIEQVFREEGVPDDIKYLVIQESALIADAVSTSILLPLKWGYVSIRKLMSVLISFRLHVEQLVI